MFIPLFCSVITHVSKKALELTSILTNERPAADLRVVPGTEFACVSPARHRDLVKRLKFVTDLNSRDF